LEVFEEYFFFFSHRLGKPLTTFQTLLLGVILHVRAISVKTRVGQAFLPVTRWLQAVNDLELAYSTTRKNASRVMMR
jgi:hypothetical protein